MKKIDKTVLSETAYIAVFSLIFSAIMQAVYLIIGKWDYTVLLGNLMGCIAAVGNFFFMGLTIQSALGKDEKQVRNAVRLSLTLRMLILAVFVGLGVLLQYDSSHHSVCISENSDSFPPALRQKARYSKRRRIIPLAFGKEVKFHWIKKVVFSGRRIYCFWCWQPCL